MTQIDYQSTSMRTARPSSRRLIILGASVVLLLLACFVWPTMHAYHYQGTTISRRNRFTSQIEFYESGRWITPVAAPAPPPMRQLTRRQFTTSELAKIQFVAGEITNVSGLPRFLDARITNNSAVHLDSFNISILIDDASQSRGYREYVQRVEPCEVLPGATVDAVLSLSGLPADATKFKVVLCAAWEVPR